MIQSRTHHRFSVADYHGMIASGILDENDRVELIRGEIVDKMPIGDLHAACVKILNRYFSHLLPHAVCVGIQDPIRLRDSEPEPDCVLLAPRDDYYASGKPTARDVLLVIEVADSSLDFDRNVKGPLYAENGVAEYWIVNLTDRAVEAHREPTAAGYASRLSFSEGESLEMLAFAGSRVLVSDLLPPRPA